MTDEQAKPPQAQAAPTPQKADSASLLIEVMKEYSLATLGLRKVMEQVRDAVEYSAEQTAILNTHIIGISIALDRQTHVDDELLAIKVGDSKANPPVPGREPTIEDRLRIIQEYEARLESEAVKIEEDEKKQRDAISAAVPEKEEAPIITSGPPSMARKHHPLPVVPRPAPASTGASPVT